MELMELYERIQNPLDDNKALDRIVEIYSKDIIQNALTHEDDRPHTNERLAKIKIDKESKEYFIVTMFNKWKKSVTSMPEKDFIDMYKKGVCDKSFLKLQRMLKKMPDAKSIQDVYAYEIDNIADEELKRALSRHSWNPIRNEPGVSWIHIKSKYINAKYLENIDVEHRLYLNPSSEDVYKVARYLVEKYEKYKIPYVFKFDAGSLRSDKIVIYTSSEFLVKNTEILQEIKNEHPEIVSKSKEPPSITGKLDNWIGYGFEPPKQDNRVESYNGFMSEIVKEAIEKATAKWILNHINTKVKYKNEELTVKDYITKVSYERLVEKTWGDPQEVQQMESEIRQFYSDILVEYLNGLLKINYENIRNEIYDIFKSKNITGKNKYTITISTDNIALKVIASHIIKADPNFREEIKEQIRLKAKTKEVDPNKICFHSKTLKRMKIQDAKERIKNLGPIKEVVKNYAHIIAILIKSDDPLIWQAFIEIINENLKNGTLSSEDLELFTSQKVMYTILDLDRFAMHYANRHATKSEISAKFNLLFDIKNINVFIACFTHPTLIENYNKANVDFSVKLFISKNLSQTDIMELILKLEELGYNELSEKIMTRITQLINGNIEQDNKPSAPKR